MELTVERDKLIAILAAAMTAHSRYMQVPVLTGIMLRAQRGELEAFCTDLWLWVGLTAPADVAEGGRVCVPARLYDYVRTLPQGAVKLRETPKFLVVEQGRSKARFSLLPAEDYPLLPDTSTWGYACIDFEPACEALERVVSCAAPDTDRPVLASCYLEWQGSKVSLTAADSFRLATTSLRLQGLPADTSAILVPAKSIRALLKAIRACPPPEETDPPMYTLDIFMPDWEPDAEVTQIGFGAGRLWLVSQLVAGIYPDYQQIVQRTETDNVVTFERDAMQRAVRRSAVLANPKFGTITLRREDDAICVSATGEIGENESWVAAKFSNDASLDISFNAKFLQHMLGVMPEVIQMYFRGAEEPARFTAPGDPYAQVIMPIYRAD